MDGNKPFVGETLRKILGSGVQIKNITNASGGCINNAIIIFTNKGDYFLKWNSEIFYEMFRVESLGLELLRKTGEVRIPEVLGLGTEFGKSFLLLEFINSGPASKSFWTEFGTSLAALHKTTNELYGLDHNNYIGRLDQKNAYKSDWVNFFIDNRLTPQIELALEKGILPFDYLKKFEELFKKLPDLLPEEKPALLHGDLWSGNFLTDQSGNPCLIDPAVYYGNREIEVSFTRLFGGFDKEFYHSYQEAFPLQQGFEERVDVYNLYPLLVHVNLFGSGYLSGISNTLKRFI
jgi:protein-ribulosamine 3-kinase